MNWRTTSRPPALSRRTFLGFVPAALGTWMLPAWAATSAAADATVLSPFNREHLPRLQIPAVTKNGAKVPITVEMAHPMSPDHHILSVQVMNRRDPIPLKGTFHFTPANGRVYLAFQARVHSGASVVSVTAECNRHGTWSGSRAITIPEDAGG